MNIESIEEIVDVLGLRSLKEHQRKAVTAFMSGSDVFTLSTGHRKSVIFAILPILFDTVKGRHVSSYRDRIL